MTRDQFATAIAKAPSTGSCGEVVFDFHGLSKAPCTRFRYTPVHEWDDSGEALEECWQAYLEEFEFDWAD